MGGLESWFGKRPSVNESVTDVSALITAVDKGEIHVRGTVRKTLNADEVALLQANYPEVIAAAGEKHMIIHDDDGRSNQVIH